MLRSWSQVAWAAQEEGAGGLGLRSRVWGAGDARGTTGTLRSVEIAEPGRQGCGGSPTILPVTIVTIPFISSNDRSSTVLATLQVLGLAFSIEAPAFVTVLTSSTNVDMNVWPLPFSMKTRQPERIRHIVCKSKVTFHMQCYSAIGAAIESPLR